MVLKREELAEGLRRIADRLDQAMNNVLVILNHSISDFQDSDLGSEIGDDMDGAAGALFVLERNFGEAIQMMGAEIDNLKQLLEDIEEDLE